MKNIVLILFVTSILASCSKNKGLADAYGNFEATEIMVSAEGSGKLLKFTVDNGQTLTTGTELGVIDTVQLSLKRRQLLAQMAGVRSRASSVMSQIDVLNSQAATVARERKRIENLLRDNAATQKQLDDIKSQAEVIERQINGIREQNQSVLSELEVIQASVAQIDDQLAKCHIQSPVNGTVLNTYAEAGELVAPGKVLFKIADLTKLDLKAYISGAQLSSIKIGQKVQVAFDKNETEMDTAEGTITWISSSSEFTPKIIQTQKERVNMVYAFKVSVANDGRMKIGMPGEVRLSNETKLK